MNPAYDDIIGRISETPAWWQEGGVPRWDAFTPERSPNIYADEAVLMEIACQGCGELFSVVMTARRHEERLSDLIIEGALHYGDPPNTGCCSSGASMNSEPRRILEYWSRSDSRYVQGTRIVDNRYFEWSRNPLFEGEYAGWTGAARPRGGQDPTAAPDQA